MEDVRTTGVPRLHHPRLHAAARTHEYVFSQLIPYIGNKRKLLHLVGAAVRSTGVARGTFVDLFSGSTVVARWAKRSGFRVLANDWEPYAYELSAGTLVPNRVPGFARLGGAERAFELLNSLPGQHGYVARHLCPEDDLVPDVGRERMFFTRANGERLDAIGETLAAWAAEGRISPGERSYVLAALVYAASYASNTSGLFKGFHHGWGGRTRTALYRILAPLRLAPPVLFDNGRENLAFREDATGLAARLAEAAGGAPDLVYLDPPYNQHPYGSNYHVLNTLVLWDKPPLEPRIEVGGRTVDKSAIRKDWRTQRRSAYNSRLGALPEFRRLVEALGSRWILLSYSTDGNMPLRDVLATLAGRGRLRVFTQPYKRYRVSTPRMSEKSHNIEFVAVVDTHARPCLPRVDGIVERILAQETEAVRPGEGALA